MKKSEMSVIWCIVLVDIIDSQQLITISEVSLRPVNHWDSAGRLIRICWLILYFR